MGGRQFRLNRRRFLALPLAGAAATTIGGQAHAQPGAAQGRPPGTDLDIVLRRGTVIDGTGRAGFLADVGIDNGYIVAVGNLADARAAVDIDADGLVVSPGFIDVHSHAGTTSIQVAESSLRQGVTTEILHPDGGGIVRIAQQLSLEEDGLGINIGAHIGFNSVWSQIVGSDDRRATPDEVERMRWWVLSGLKNGAWGVSLGLEYTPTFFAETDQVIDVVSVARDWRTNTQSHIRNEHSGVLDAVAEHFEIGETAGLVPLVTHHKIMNCCWGQSTASLALMDQMNARGTYAAMDQYPYLAASTALPWIVPRWVLDGGRAGYLARFADPELRPQIEQEIHELIESKVGVAENVDILPLRQTLADVANNEWDDSPVTPGEATMRILEERGSLSAIWHFGNEDDVQRIMRHPLVAVASDGGATTSTNTHPRRYGTFPRVLGRYVREQGVISLEEAVRKMTYLPATMMGMVDRGLLMPGMTADVTVFDPDTVIDNATFEEPRQFPDGIEHVIVNGQLALTGGALNAGIQAGRSLRRRGSEISRPVTGTDQVKATVRGRLVPPARPEPDGAVFSTDFSGDVAGQPPAGWTERWRAGDWTVQDDPRRLQMGAMSGRRALTWDAVGDIDGDVELFGRMRGHGNTIVFQLGLHTSGAAGSENSYFLRAMVHDSPETPNEVQIGRYLGSEFFNLDRKVLPDPVEEDAWYRVLIRREADWLRGKMWPDGAAEPPDWQVNVAAFDPEVVIGTGGVGPLYCCPGGVTEWSFISAGTGGMRAPRLPGDPPPVEADHWRHAQVTFNATGEGAEASGQLVLNVADRALRFRSTALGKLQVTDGWATITGRGQLAGEEQERSFVLILDQEDLLEDGETTVTVEIEDGYVLKGLLERGTSRVDTSA